MTVDMMIKPVEFYSFILTLIDSTEFLEDTSEDIKHEAFWTLNEVETSADILSKNSIFCNKLPIMKTKLKIGEMVSNVRLYNMWHVSILCFNSFFLVFLHLNPKQVRGTLHWKTFNKDGTVAVCVIIPIVLVKSTSSTDEVKIPKQSLTPTPTPMPTPTPTPMPTPKPTLIPKDSSSIEDRLNATQSKTAE